MTRDDLVTLYGLLDRYKHATDIHSSLAAVQVQQAVASALVEEDFKKGRLTDGRE